MLTFLFLILSNSFLALSFLAISAISLDTTLLPTGQKDIPANLKDCRPNGIKIIVIQEMTPATKYIKNSIKILGKGEESLAVNTPDDTKQPANRRVEIKKTN